MVKEQQLNRAKFGGSDWEGPQAETAGCYYELNEKEIGNHSQCLFSTDENP